MAVLGGLGLLFAPVFGTLIVAMPAPAGGGESVLLTVSPAMGVQAVLEADPAARILAVRLGGALVFFRSARAGGVGKVRSGWVFAAGGAGCSPNR